MTATSNMPANILIGELPSDFFDFDPFLVDEKDITNLILDNRIVRNAHFVQQDAQNGGTIYATADHHYYHITRIDADNITIARTTAPQADE